MVVITRRFESSSSSAVYTAMISDANLLSCDCRGWTMLRAGKPRHCKHTKELAAGRKTEIRGDYVYLVGPTDDECDDAPGPLRRAEAATMPVAKTAPPAKTGAPIPTAAPIPMLASAGVDGPVTGAAFDRRFSAGWYLEEKIDGHRCVAVVADGRVVAYGRPRGDSRPEKRLPANIVERLREFPNGIYDGELVEATGSGAKSWNVTVVGAQLVFVIFDVVELLGESIAGWRYEDRREALLTILATLPKEQTAISTVRSIEPSWSAVEAIWAKGGEGAILKRAGSRYRPGHRSPDWIKVKSVAAATLTIVGFEPAKNGPHAVMKLRGADGVETTIKTPDNATLRAIAKNPESYVGRRVVISFQERTPSGSYRHPMFDHFAGEAE